MPRYVIEREVPGVGQLSSAELQAISKQSVSIIDELGQGLVWLQSFVADDKIYCVYDSPNAELIHVHARCMGLPANVVSEVRVIVDPATATATATAKG
jgi:hypothetical protein